MNPADNQRLGYRLTVRNGSDHLRFDIVGASSRYLPNPPFTAAPQRRMWETGEIARREAPAGAGRFTGRFSSSANQAARYAEWRREMEEFEFQTSTR